MQNLDPLQTHNVESRSDWRKLVAILSMSVFTVALGYGVLLPLLPDLVKASLGRDDPAQTARHLGMMTAIYAGAPVLFGPSWGKLCDRIGSKPVLTIGLVGFALSSLTPGFETSLWSIHAGRLVNGAFAAAVSPAALTMIANQSTGPLRARGFAWVAMATIAGFFTGPLLGRAELALGSVLSGPERLLFPLALAAVLALLICLLAQRALPAERAARQPAASGPGLGRGIAIRLLVLAAVTAGATASFEVSLVLHARRAGMGPNDLAVMFAECSLFMLVGQAIFFTSLLRVESSKWLIGPALVAMGTGLFLMPTASGFVSSVVVGGLISLAGGVALPVISYWLSLSSPRSAGLQQGVKTAVTSIGQSLGSLLAGFLFAPWLVADAPFYVTGAVVLITGTWALFLPKHLRQQSPA